jgi:hypothetical protein
MKLKSVEAWRHYPIDVFLPGNLISFYQRDTGDREREATEFRSKFTGNSTAHVIDLESDIEDGKIA